MTNGMEEKPMKAEAGEMMEAKEIRSIPVVSFALITALVTAIVTLIIGIIEAIIGTAILGTIVSVLPQNATAAASTIEAFSSAAALYLIVVWPILAFIGTFIGLAVAAIIYNFLAPRIGGIKLKFM